MNNYNHSYNTYLFTATLLESMKHENMKNLCYCLRHRILFTFLHSLQIK